MQTLQEWEKWVISESDYKNHRRFTLRCISKGIIPVNVRLKSSSINCSRRAREIIYRSEKLLLQDRVKCINGILWNNEGKLERRSRLSALVTTTTTTTTKDRCIEFINKVREARYVKVKNRQVNKFNRLLAKSGNGSEINTQSSNNNNQSQVVNSNRHQSEAINSNSSNRNQLQTSGANNKGVINLSNTPLTPVQECLLAKAPNYAIVPNPILM